MKNVRTAAVAVALATLMLLPVAATASETAPDAASTPSATSTADPSPEVSQEPTPEKATETQPAPAEIADPKAADAPEVKVEKAPEQQQASETIADAGRTVKRVVTEVRDGLARAVEDPTRLDAPLVRDHGVANTRRGAEIEVDALAGSFVDPDEGPLVLIDVSPIRTGTDGTGTDFAQGRGPKPTADLQWDASGRVRVTLKADEASEDRILLGYFLYTVRDQAGQTAQGTITVRDEAALEETIAFDDEVAVRMCPDVGASRQLLATITNDRVASYDKYTTEILTQPSRGTVTLGSPDVLSQPLRFSAPASDAGTTTSFTYRLRWNGGVSAPATVTLTLSEPQNCTTPPTEPSDSGFYAVVFDALSGPTAHLDALQRARARFGDNVTLLTRSETSNHGKWEPTGDYTLLDRSAETAADWSGGHTSNVHDEKVFDVLDGTGKRIGGYIFTADWVSPNHKWLDPFNTSEGDTPSVSDDVVYVGTNSPGSTDRKVSIRPLLNDDRGGIRAFGEPVTLVDADGSSHSVTDRSWLWLWKSTLSGNPVLGTLKAAGPGLGEEVDFRDPASMFGSGGERNDLVYTPGSVAGEDVVTYERCNAAPRKVPGAACQTARIRIVVAPDALARDDHETTTRGVEVTSVVMANDRFTDTPERAAGVAVAIDASALPDGVTAVVNSDRTVTVTADEGYEPDSVVVPYVLSDFTGRSSATITVDLAVPEDPEPPVVTPTPNPDPTPEPPIDPPTLTDPPVTPEPTDPTPTPTDPTPTAEPPTPTSDRPCESDCGGLPNTGGPVGLALLAALSAGVAGAVLIGKRNRKTNKENADV